MIIVKRRHRVSQTIRFATVRTVRFSTRTVFTAVAPSSHIRRVGVHHA